MSVIRCKGCGDEFGGDEHGESARFDQHVCPNHVEPLDGESWEDYKARAEKIRAAAEVRLGDVMTVVSRLLREVADSDSFDFEAIHDGDFRRRAMALLELLES